MEVQITCENCGSSIEVYPDINANQVECDVCNHNQPVHFNTDHENSIVEVCPCCQRKDFYKQKDFNRAVGVTLFIIASILAIWTYGISLIVLYLVDLFLFKKLSSIIVCYKCGTIFRNAKNVGSVPDFNHEMHDRIKYSDHDFQGKPLEH
ncbi:MAG: hypothetical protein H6621_05220 [Halobacteriovoraceae bacterium]|nr:hypothetical protein [Halobacteriovoraceae bacterium]